MDILLTKNRAMREFLKTGRENITSGVITGRKEPVTSPPGTTQSSAYSPFRDSDYKAPLTMLETQSSPTDREAIVILGSLSLNLNVGDSQTKDIKDLSALQEIIKGVPAFQVYNEK